MYSLLDIALLVGGEVVGQENKTIASIGSLQSSDTNCITFYADKKLQPMLSGCNAGAMLISSANAALFSGNKILVDDPYLAYAKISVLFRNSKSTNQKSVDTTALVQSDSRIDASASIGVFSSIGSNTTIAANVIIGNGVQVADNVSIGVSTVIEDNAVICSGTRIGQNCFLSPGVVIGASGFGYAPDGQGWQKIEQLGTVIIGDDVDIGANTTIDRGALENTIIGDGVKLDNQIQIAHNVTVGEHTIMAGCVGIAGSTKIGKRCKIGARVGVLGHLVLADDVTILANSLVINSIQEPGEYASTIGVQPAKKWLKTVAIIRRLDKLAEKVKALGGP